METAQDTDAIYKIGAVFNDREFLRQGSFRLTKADKARLFAPSSAMQGNGTVSGTLPVIPGLKRHE